MQTLQLSLQEELEDILKNMIEEEVALRKKNTTDTIEEMDEKLAEIYALVLCVASADEIEEELKELKDLIEAFGAELEPVHQISDLTARLNRLEVEFGEGLCEAGWRTGGRCVREIGRQVADISRQVTDISRQVTDISTQVATEIGQSVVVQHFRDAWEERRGLMGQGRRGIGMGIDMGIDMVEMIRDTREGSTENHVLAGQIIGQEPIRVEAFLRGSALGEWVVGGERGEGGGRDTDDILLLSVGDTTTSELSEGAGSSSVYFSDDDSTTSISSDSISLDSISPKSISPKSISSPCHSCSSCPSSPLL